MAEKYDVEMMPRIEDLDLEEDCVPYRVCEDGTLKLNRATNECVLIDDEGMLAEFTAGCLAKDLFFSKKEMKCIPY